MTLRLSPHFELWEFVESDTARRHNIGNEPNAKTIEALRLVCGAVLEPTRLKFGTIRIVSGYRCAELNKLVGGAVRSQHTKGQAVDFVVRNVPHMDVIRWMRHNTPYDQLILEFPDPNDPHKGWIHVSHHTGRRRREVLSATKDSDHKTKYDVLDP